MFIKDCFKLSKMKLTKILSRGTNFVMQIGGRKYCNITSLQDNVPQVSAAVVKKTLKFHNIHYSDGFTCVIAQCPMCGKNKKTLNNLYINKTTGTFSCVSCKTTGMWGTLQNYFEKKHTEKAGVKNEHDDLRQCLEQIKKETQLLSGTDCDLSKVLSKFKLPEVSKSCLQTLEVLVDKSENHLYFPIENASFECVGYRKLSAKSGMDEVVPNNSYGGLLIAKGSKNKEKGILVPFLSDFLTLLNARTTYSIICLPNGVQTFPQIFLPSLERYKKLILWFGNAIKSWDIARYFSKKLGDERCVFVRPSENNISKNLKSHDLNQIINDARPVWHKCVTSFASLRQDVLTDLQNIDQVEGTKWKRFQTLNKILKGHRRGELTVVTGPTGSGKTTFISEYSLDLAMQNVNTLWGSFEIRNSRLAKIMLHQYAGLPLQENIQLFNKWADEFEKLPIYFMTFHGPQNIKTVMDAIEHATYAYDIAHVIIDNLQFMMGVSNEEKHIDRFWKQDVIIGAFRTFATQMNCHVTLVIHPRKERVDEDLTAASIFGGAKATQEADNVLILQDKTLVSVNGKKYLQVVKNRYSGDLGVMPLEFNKPSLSFAQKRRKQERS